MKKCLLFSLLFYSNFTFSQLNDSFTDGDFTNGPVWQGNVASFIVNGSKQLQTTSSALIQTVNLSAANSLALNAKWEFSVQLNFDPSTNNQVRVYLMSDNVNLTAGLNGYFLQIGESGSTDSYDLYRQNGTTITKIIDGPAKTRGNSTILKAQVMITRDGSGSWELQTAIDGSPTFITEGSVTDNTFINTAYFGVSCKYTPTNSSKFIFDDFKIESTIPPDTDPPQLTSITAIDTLTLEALFNEPIESTSAQIISNYSLNNGYGHPSQILTTADPAKYRLKYPSGLVTGSYMLTVSNVKDLSNNSITGNNTASLNYVKPYIAKKGDLVINEIFANPSPQVDLPSVEFIEILNTSAHKLHLQNWKYKDVTTTVNLPTDSILSGELLIICAKADTNEYKVYGRTLGISPWPSLNNSGDVLKLISPENLITDSVAYRDSWYKDATKKAGGWTLERIVSKPICSGIQNWSASKDPSGGTPGKKNSIFENTNPSPLQLSQALLTDSVTVTLNFNKYVDSLSASLSGNYSVNNGLGIPIKALPKGPDFQQVDLTFSSIAQGKNYTVTVNNVTDCAGGLINITGNSKEFIYPEKVVKSNILINEILFNPRNDGVDFVEIYNATDHLLDLKEVSLATTTEKDSLSSIKPLSSTQLLFEPKTYLVLTSDPDKIKQAYHAQSPNAFLKLSTLPSFNDDKGVVVLLADNNRIDQLNYSEKMHFPLIKNPEGVSLERSSFKNPTNEPGNFRSAAATVGYATPGYKNSQYVESEVLTEEIELASNTFSPDNDGFEDVLTLNYRLDNSGMVANASVYNDQGVLIKRINKNTTLATEGTLIWDGLNEQNERAPIGIYVVYVELFNPNGQVKKYRKNVVLAGKLN